MLSIDEIPAEAVNTYTRSIVMDIKLTQLFFAFFLRTEFVDIADTEKKLEN